MTTTKSQVPVSQATNSYELLGEVIKAIRAEPKRIYMENYVHHPDLDYEEDGPPCGTVGCIAGWAVMLAKPKVFLNWRNVQFSQDELAESAGAVFLRTYKQLLAGRNPSEALRFELQDLVLGHGGYPWPQAYLYGTEEYAAAVIKNIRKFMRRHAPELKAHVLKPRKA